MSRLGHTVGFCKTPGESYKPQRKLEGRLADWPDSYPNNLGYYRDRKSSNCHELYQTSAMSTCDFALTISCERRLAPTFTCRDFEQARLESQTPSVERS